MDKVDAFVQSGDEAFGRDLRMLCTERRRWLGNTVAWEGRRGVVDHMVTMREDVVESIQTSRVKDCWFARLFRGTCRRLYADLWTPITHSASRIHTAELNKLDSIRFDSLRFSRSANLWPRVNNKQTRKGKAFQEQGGTVCVYPVEH